jgi:hypothetical protein
VHKDNHTRIGEWLRLCSDSAFSSTKETSLARMQSLKQTIFEDPVRSVAELAIYAIRHDMFHAVACECPLSLEENDALGVERTSSEIALPSYFNRSSDLSFSLSLVRSPTHRRLVD